MPCSLWGNSKLGLAEEIYFAANLQNTLLTIELVGLKVKSYELLSDGS